MIPGGQFPFPYPCWPSPSRARFHQRVNGLGLTECNQVRSGIHRCSMSDDPGLRVGLVARLPHAQTGWRAPDAAHAVLLRVEVNRSQVAGIQGNPEPNRSDEQAVTRRVKDGGVNDTLALSDMASKADSAHRIIMR